MGDDFVDREKDYRSSENIKELNEYKYHETAKKENNFLVTEVNRTSDYLKSITSIILPAYATLTIISLIYMLICIFYANVKIDKNYVVVAFFSHLIFLPAYAFAIEKYVDKTKKSIYERARSALKIQMVMLIIYVASLIAISFYIDDEGMLFSLIFAWLLPILAAGIASQAK